MRILITGGAGFLGSHLCEYLLGKGHQVMCMDTFITGKEENINRLKEYPKFSFIHHDVTNFISIQGKLDFVMHFASPASPIDYQEIPIQTLKAGALGTHNCLGLALSKNAKFFLASTSEVYGDPLINPQPETYWGNVNPIGVRGCFSEDTEILTYEGWKFFKDLKQNDQILTLNQRNIFEYHKPIEIIKERYQGQLIHFDNSKIDIMVTPNHKMYVKKRDSQKFELIEALESIQWHRANMAKSGRWVSKRKKYFYLQPVQNNKYGNIRKILMDDWLEFFGYFITEGCVYNRQRKRTINGKEYHTSSYTVLIAQDRKNKEIRKRIYNCLSRLPFNFFDSDDHQFRIENKQLAAYLKQFGKARDKYIPSEFKNLSKDQIRILFEAMMAGDGSKEGTKYYSSSLRLINDVQEILLKLGIAGTVRLTDKRKENPVYSTHILTNKKRNFLSPLYPKRKITSYNGYVYCVNVSNHLIYVRRNGKALFCGNCYDEGKRYAEALTMAYHRIHGLETKIARIFNTYGPRMRKDDGRVVPAFVNQAINNEPITIFGRGNQTRSFCYVSDLIEGLSKLMDSDINDPVNLGNPQEMSILDFANKIKEVTKSSSKIVYKKLPEDDPHVRRPDIQFAKTRLGWEPKVELEEGLKKTIDFFKGTG